MTDIALFDGELQAIQFALEGVGNTGSSVRIRKLEVEILEHVDIVRNMMMSTLHCEGGDRSSLQLSFGGDCARISQTRLLLECAQKLLLKDGFKKDSTRAEERRACLGRCLAACQSVEKVLEDSGLGLALRMAQDARGRECKQLVQYASQVELPQHKIQQAVHPTFVECTPGTLFFEDVDEFAEVESDNSNSFLGETADRPCEQGFDERSEACITHAESVSSKTKTDYGDDVASLAGEVEDMAESEHKATVDSKEQTVRVDARVGLDVVEIFSEDAGDESCEHERSEACRALAESVSPKAKTANGDDVVPLEGVLEHIAKSEYDHSVDGEELALRVDAVVDSGSVELFSGDAEDDSCEQVVDEKSEACRAHAESVSSKTKIDYGDDVASLAGEVEHMNKSGYVIDSPMESSHLHTADLMAQITEAKFASDESTFVGEETESTSTGERIVDEALVHLDIDSMAEALTDTLTDEIRVMEASSSHRSAPLPLCEPKSKDVQTMPTVTSNESIVREDDDIVRSSFGCSLAETCKDATSDCFLQTRKYSQDSRCSSNFQNIENKLPSGQKGQFQEGQSKSESGSCQRESDESGMRDAGELSRRVQRRASDVNPRIRTPQSSVSSELHQKKRKSLPIPRLALDDLQSNKGQRKSLPARPKEMEHALTDRTERRKTISLPTSGKILQFGTRRHSSASISTPSNVRSHSASEVGYTPRSGYGSPSRRRSSGQLSTLPRKAFEITVRDYHDEYTIMDALTSSERDLIKQIFALYVGPGGMSLGAGLSLSKFRRLLKACGLINEDGVSITASFPVSYERRNSVSSRQKSPTNAVAWRALSGSQADLIVSRATNAVVDGQLSLKLGSPGSLALALSDVAAYCGSSDIDLNHVTCLKSFCSLYLGPLHHRAMTQKETENDVWDVSSFEALFDDSETAGLLRRSHRRLATIFYNYGKQRGGAPPYRHGYWTAAILAKFIFDSGLGRALNNSMCYKLFDEVTNLEYQAGKGKEDMLTYRGLQLCLIAIAETTFKATKPSPAERLRILLLRLNALNADDLSTFQSKS